VLHLETYGSADRPVQKGSQYLTLDRDAGATLMRLLREAFPELTDSDPAGG
jgi:hypothetical protein